METKIIQLIPVPAGLYGLAWDDCGNRRTVPLVAVALTETGKVVFLYLDNGIVARTSEAISKG